MRKFDAIIAKYSKCGVSSNNIEYAISAVKDGTKREHILESLTADYRGMSYEQATTLLEDLFLVNGGEFKKENRDGYLYATLFLSIGIGCSFYIFYAFAYGGVLLRPVLVFLGAISGLGVGILYFVKSLRGKYRDTDEPFNE